MIIFAKLAKRIKQKKITLYNILEDSKMKKLGVIAVGLTMMLSSCTMMNTGDSGYDDVYTSSSNSKVENQQYTHKEAVQKRVAQNPSSDQGITPTENVQQEPVLETQNMEQYTEPRQTNSQSYSDGAGNTYVTNNYYSDDEYDYYYASRIRRFHNYDYGWGYYDPWYTNQYWYSYNPCSWGVSIYMGYNWMWGNSYYRPYDYYAPGYWSYGGFGYNHGYNHGYWDGYRDGYYANGYNNYSDYYYNSHDDNTTHYYGHRSALGSSGGYTGGGHRTASSNGALSSTPVNDNRNTAFGERYENTIRRTPTDMSATAITPAEKRSTPDRGAVNQRQVSTQGGGAANVRTSVPNQRVESPTTPSAPVATPGRNTNNNSTVNTNRVESTPSQGATNVTPTRGSYARPNQTDANRPQSSGAYSRPNAQEGTTAPASSNGRYGSGYSAPANSNNRQTNYNYQKPAETETKSYNTNRSNGNNPSYYNYQRNENSGQYNTPSRTNTTTPTYSRPAQSSETKTYNSNNTSRSSQEYSVPSNNNRSSNYSQPSNSSSYSRPSSSGSSYSTPSSTPSRSSGSSSGGTRSGGNSSGGRHR